VVRFPNEPAHDEGGVSREFFALVGNKLFGSSGLFAKVNNDVYYWFRPDWEMTGDDWRNDMTAAGSLLRMAITNGVVLPFRLPHVLYRKLKGNDLSILDYAELYPEQAHHLEEARKAYMDRGADYDLHFSATAVIDGTPRDLPLIEGQGDRKVTKENFDEYIAALVEYYLVTIVDGSFAPFRRAFMMDGETMAMGKLTSYDFEMLLGGSDVMDWAALQQNAAYDGYSATSETVVTFWKVFNGMSEGEKAKLLQFVTGSSRAPVGGLQMVKIVIQRGVDVRRVPTAHTCFNRLVLPDDPSEARMREQLTVCIANCEGFGLI
jgi:hypothetical protein